MDVDSNLKSEPPVNPAQAKEAMVVDNSLDDDYVPGQDGQGDVESDTGKAKDEAALFKEFLAQWKKIKMCVPVAAKTVPLKASVVASKRLSKTKMVVNKFEMAKKHPSQLSDQEDWSTKCPKSDSIGGLVAN
ncbi:hypothetical protein ARMSODRAFT_1016021 [Armillaria solidipes]|uniref:Uncharacterized protein n=1 Tax=Armillaria solidipes TaxID=1076256 RepID=A0A2H3BQS7_9AGAR|nr:hypothetical protein ARMSODRAFT_1016021 [Armillaria solidipes]